jgi:hypothetical protein
MIEIDEVSEQLCSPTRIYLTLSPPLKSPEHDARGLFFPLGRSPPSASPRPTQVFDPAADQMKTTAEAADVIPLGASFPSLAMGMGDGRARCFRQGLP